MSGPVLDQLRMGVLKVFDLKGQIDLNQRECDQLIERVSVLTSGILDGTAQGNGGAQDSRGLRALNKVVGDIERYLGTVRTKRVFAHAIHSDEISRQLRTFEDQLATAYSRYQTDIGQAQTTMLVAHTSTLDVQTGMLDSQLSALNTQSAILDQHTQILGSVAATVDSIAVAMTERLAIGSDRAPTYLPLGDLPPKPMIVVGRDREVQVVLQALLASKPSHIAILGFGGIGKTTLTLLILHDPDIEKKFGDGRAFIKCDGIVSAEGVISAVASEFNVAASEGVSVHKALIRHLRSCPQPILLVLDNLETAWDTDDQEAVEAFLTSLCNISAVSLVITMRGTRSPHGQDWIQFEPLGPLRPEHTKELFLRICGGRRATHDPYLDALLELLDGLPLAIMLLASIGKSGYSPSELLTTYQEEKTAMLAKGRANNRMSSLEISIELSLGSRTVQDNSDALILLALISLLPDGIHDNDLARVFPTMKGCKRAARVLHQAALCTHRDGVSRVLAPIRTYMLEQPDYSPKGVHLEQLRRFYINLVVQGRRAVVLTAKAKDQLTAQMNNAQSVLTHAMHGDVDGRIILEAVEALGYLSYMSHFGSCSSLLQDAITTYTENPEQGKAFSPFLAACMQVLGNILAKEANYQDAKIALEEAKATFQLIGYDRSAAQCTQSLGNILRMQLEYDDANATLLEARLVFLEVGDKRGAAQCTKRLGDILRFQAEYPAAIAKLQAAKSEFESIDDRLGSAECMHGLGAILVIQDDLVGASAALQEAEKTFREFNDRLGVAQCTQDRGDILRLQADFDGATKALEDARSAFQELGDKHGVAGCTYSLGTVLQSRGQFEQAIETFEEAKGMLEEMGMERGVTDCLREIDRTVRSRESREVRVSWRGKDEGDVGDVVTVYDEALPAEVMASVRHLAWCDLCRQEIVGTRYKCLDCDDYDLCSACLPRRTEEHIPHHSFAELDRQTRLFIQRTSDVSQTFQPFVLVSL